MKIKYMVSKFFVVSLDFGKSGCDDICFNAKEISDTIAKFIKANNNSENKGCIIIRKYVVTNKEIVEDLSQDEFIRMYFDNIEWVIDGIKEIEKISIDL